MDYVLFAMGAILLLTGFVGCIIPVLPGLPMAFVGLILLSFTSFTNFNAGHLIALGVVVVTVSLLDYFVPIFGSKLFGVSKHGIIGSLIGMFIGLILFPPFGIILGIIIGAIAGEYVSGKKHLGAMWAGLVTFVLTLAMFIAKLSICGYIGYAFITECLDAIDLPQLI